MTEPPAQRHLVLILARSFASRLATAVFLVDEQGRVIYFNEAAEGLLGQRFIEGHGMSLEETRERFRPSDDDGQPARHPRDAARRRRSRATSPPTDGS